MIPESITKLIADRKTPTPRADHEIRPGDLRRGASGGDERLLLVLKVNPRRNTVQVTLVHAYPELATGADVIIAPSVTGLTYPVVVEADLRRTFWTRDLDRCVGEVPPQVVDACLSPKSLIPEGDGLSTGSRLTGPLEARWQFKADERHELSNLCTECTTAVLDEVPVELDVDEIYTTLLAPARNASKMIEALKTLILTRGDSLVFTLDHLDLLESQGLLSEERWSAALGLDGIEFLRGPMQRLVTRALSQATRPAVEPEVRIGVRELVGAATV